MYSLGHKGTGRVSIIFVALIRFSDYNIPTDELLFTVQEVSTSLIVS